MADSKTLRRFALGERIPDSPHAVVVSLPTMAAVVAYEEGCETTAGSLKSGYPRFRRHPDVARLAELFAEKLGLAGRALFPVCSRVAAEAARDFCAAKDARIDDAPEGWSLLSLAAGEKEAALRAKKHLQHTGSQISSRFAEDALAAAGLITAVFPEALFAGDAEGRVIDAILPLLAPAGRSDIALCRAGMAAMHAAWLAARDIARERGRTIWIQLGWLYVDTPEILTKFAGPGETHVFFPDDTAFGALEKFFEDNADRIAGLVTEFPTNPLIRCGDIARLSELCERHGVVRIFDPSSAGLVNTDVLRHADLLPASLTKYAGSAGDVMLGVVAVNPAGPFAAALREKIFALREAPYSRDLARLAAQIGDMESTASAVNANTMRLAAHLSSHPRVRRVHWAYAPETADAYAKIARGRERPGALITIEVAGSVARFYDRLRCAKGPSFGATFTIACPFAYLAHYGLVSTAEGRAELIARGLDPELIRISVGAEPFEELRAVFDEALA